MLKNRRWLWAVLAPLLFLFQPAGSLGQEEENYRSSREVAGELVRALNGTRNINYLSVEYEVILDCDMYVSLKTVVTLEMYLNQGFSLGAGAAKEYLSSFSLTPPEAVGLWSKFAMAMVWLDGNKKEEYEDMLKSLNVRVEETFMAGSNLRTINLRQIIRKKNYANQTPIELEFKDGQIYFWPDAEKKQITPQTLPYSTQVGPLTGFFNYLLYYRISEQFCVVNVLNRTRDTGERDKLSGLKIKAVEFLFKDQTITIEKNMPSKTVPYNHLISFEGDNFLDLVQGKISFDLYSVSGNPEKAPYAISVEGVFSKNKLYRQNEDLKVLMNRKNELSPAVFEQMLKEIKSRNTLSAWNIRCYLTGYNLNGKVYTVLSKKK